MINNKDLPNFHILKKNIDFCLYSCLILIFAFLIFSNIFLNSLSNEFVIISVLLLSYSLFYLWRAVRISSVLSVELSLNDNDKTSISTSYNHNILFKFICLISLTDMFKIIAGETIIFWGMFLYLVKTNQWNDTIYMSLLLIPQVSLPIFVVMHDFRKLAKNKK